MSARRSRRKLTRCSYFVVYEAVKKQLTPAGQDPSSLSLSAVILAGASAGVAMWTFAIPPDVRRRATSDGADAAHRSSSPDSRVRPRVSTRALSTAQ